MILIAHRGNTQGPNLDRENSPDYIIEAMDKGYSVEVDVWYRDKSFWLGHDSPLHKIQEDFLVDDRIWCHAKNLKALEKMITNSKIHCFWHQDDDYTLTNNGYIWTYPGKHLSERSICVMPEISMSIHDISNLKCFGICSDIVDELTFLIEKTK